MDLSHRVPKLTLVPASWKKNIRTCHQESNPHSLWEREPQRKARDGFFTPPVAPAWVKATGDPHHTAYHHFGSPPKTMLNSAPFIKHILKQADHLGDSSPSHINTATAFPRPLPSQKELGISMTTVIKVSQVTSAIIGAQSFTWGLKAFGWLHDGRKGENFHKLPH